ncbi:conserved repeat domain protein [[Leptolyngbya] sp. PCC 7376]|uniref:DUF11 domain-containing protein n=1 Tax=[Leptolyngbya] sp. PCC 7376 TaxID=111781 RepID=UPI00029EFB47|nr:DUF11 domain-containing protein [[Leptolyngbya] sp. PCC 7376]AFY37801.1 conserved repeat domain protein [[Leptolyngbya] sp. PCC 7376]
MSGYNFYSFLQQSLYQLWHHGSRKRTDLSVSVTNGVQEVFAGGEVVYTITVRNHSKRTVYGASLSDSLPSDLQDVEYYKGSVSLENQLEIDSLEDLSFKVPAYGSITYQVKGTIAPDAIGDLDYSVGVDVPRKYVDKNPYNNFDTDSDHLISLADLAITVTNDVDTVILGDEVVYAVTVTNNGVANVADANLSEFLSESLADVSYYLDAVDPGNLLEVGSLDEILVSLAAGEAVTYKVKGTVAELGSGELEYGVQVNVPDNVVDPNPHNNLAYDPGDGVDIDENGIDGDRILSLVDLAVSKVFDLTTVEALDNNGDGLADQYIATPSDQYTDSFVEYTLMVTNNGEATAQNVLLTEDLTQGMPFGLEFDQFIDLDGGTVLDTDENANTIEVGFEHLAAGESREVKVRAKIDAVKAFEFSAVFGNQDPGSDVINADIPEYSNLLLQGKFFLSPDLDKEAGSQVVNFNHLNIQNTAEVTSDSFETNTFDNSSTSRLDLTTIALDGELNNGSDVIIRSVERLGVIGSTRSYSLNPDPILVNGQNLLQFGVTNPFVGFGLNSGGTVTFEIRDVSGTAGADGIFGNTDDSGEGTLVTSFDVTDGGTDDLDADASEIIAEWAVDLAFLDPTKTFRLTTSTVDPTLGTQQFINYFDINGNAIPANTTDTTSNSLFINTSVGESEGVVVQANVTNPFSGFGLAAGGSANFTISEVTGTAGADGIFGNADDDVTGRQVLQTLAVTDGSSSDLDSDSAEVSAEFLIAKSLGESTSRVFAITTTVNDSAFGAQTFTNYFDINGQAIPANTTDTSDNSLFIDVALNTLTVTNGDSAFPTYNNSDFLLSGDLNNDGILDQFGGSLSEFIWNKIDDPQYLADLAVWESLDSDVEGEQAVIDFLLDKFLSAEVFSFENFQEGSFTLENEVGDRTTLEILDVELTPDDGEPDNTPDSMELLVNDHGVIFGDICYSSLEEALSDLSFAEPVRLNITFDDSNGDGKVKTFLQNLEPGLNTEQNWFVGEIKINSSVTGEVLLDGGNGRSHIDLSRIIVNVDGEGTPDLIIAGGNSKDAIVGSSFGEIIKGNNGKDVLSGFDGDDQIIGGKGFDIINGGRGDDLLSGGGYYTGYYANFFEHRERNQKDKFVFEGDFGNDVITDFGWFKDRLDISDFNLDISNLDTNGDRHINGHDNSAFVGVSNGDLMFDLTSVGGGTILLEDVHSIKAHTVIV